MEGELSVTPTDSISFLLNGTYGPNQQDQSNSKLGAIDPILTWKTPLRRPAANRRVPLCHEIGPISVRSCRLLTAIRFPAE